MTIPDQHDPAQGGIVPPGLELVRLTLSKDQVGVIVFCLMEGAKGVEIQRQMDWSRLAIGLNDLLVRSDDEPASEG